MSLIDIYDEDMNLLGTATISQAHSEGLWHKNFHCWILDDSKVWLQVRSTKDFYPNKFDMSCAGHLETGETPKQAGRREIEEELGVEVNEDEFEKMFTYKTIVDYPGYCNREFCPTYAIKKHITTNDIDLEPNEVVGFYAAELGDLIDLFENEIEKINVCGILSDGTQSNITITKESFVPRGESYYLKAFSTLERMI
ncbi:MAG: NUDIX domain-containing protein [Alphaproteobacteria bacterium]|nr:NUDIX domain-containing protein [Alphaproteobacteria bacterium]